MDKHEEYIKLLEGFINICEANKGLAVKNENWILDAEGLALKFCAHATSALYLFRGTKIPEIKIGNISFFDYASLNILCRAAFETFLIFHHLFIQPNSDEEKEFRYDSWVLSGLLERQGFPVKSPQGIKLIESERSIINSLKDRLHKNKVFINLTHKQQRTITEKGNWRRKSWYEIAKDSGLDETHAGSFYRYLCGYAHSGSLSSLQLRESQTRETQKQMAESGMTLIMISMAKMIESYCKLFSKSKKALLQNSDVYNLVKVWIGVGSSSLNDIEIDWGEMPLNIS